jgi:DNA-binding CsgD family transcriptional regulator
MAPQRNRDHPQVSGGRRATGSRASPIESGVPARFGSLRFDAVLIDLDSLAVRAVTEDARRVLARPIESIVGYPLLDFLDPVERNDAAAALQAMRSGAIEFYRAHRQVSIAPGGALWAWAVELAGRRYAFVAWLDSDLDQSSERMAAMQEVLEHTVAIGIADAACIVRYASVEAGNTLGIDAETLVGTRLADAGRNRQLESIAGAERAPHDGLSVSFPVQIASRTGALITLTCVVTSSPDWPDRLFLLAQPPNLPREVELEQHLWRIAAEVEASGILLGLGSDRSLVFHRHPEAASLSLKQWEILRRIVAGERVPTIARDLYISQSTVRNHLSAIFERFGVHSQADLLAVLAQRDIASSETDTVSMA